MASGPSIAVSAIALLFLGNVVLVRLILPRRDRIPQPRPGSLGQPLGRGLCDRAHGATAALACHRVPCIEPGGMGGMAVWRTPALCAGGTDVAPAAWPAAVRRFCARNCARAFMFSSQFVVRAIRSNVDLFVIGLFTPIETVGSYGVARRIMDSSYLSIDAFNRLIYPRLRAPAATACTSRRPRQSDALAAALGLGARRPACILFVLAPSCRGCSAASTMISRSSCAAVRHGDPDRRLGSRDGSCWGHRDAKARAR